MSIYIAAYDISHPSRRRQVADVLMQYGRRRQRSVFELWLDPADVIELRRRIGMLLDVKDDFDLYPVDERGTRRHLSWQRPPEIDGPVLPL